LDKIRIKVDINGTKYIPHRRAHQDGLRHSY
jgi:hypothetical protein